MFDPDGLEVTPEQTEQATTAGEAQLIDVREPYEWDAGRIEGAVHIPLDQLSAKADTIDKDRPVIFLCRLGARSAMAAQAFRASGFQAWSMAGGLVRWDEEGRAMVPDGATVAEH